MTIQTDIKPTGYESGVVYAPFDKGKEELESSGLEIISLPINAELRIQQGKDANVSRNGNWVREGVIYMPKAGNKLARNSSILESAREATESHRNGKEFYPTQEQIDRALQDSVEFPDRDIEIPVNRFGEDSLMVYAVGNGDSKKAQIYGDFLSEAGIKAMPIWVADKDYVSKQEKPFERLALFLSLLDDRSVLYGYDRGLNYDLRVRGVRLVPSAEGASQKIEQGKNSELYTAKNLQEALHSVGITGNVEKSILFALARKH